MIDSLMYLTNTRLDICFVVNTLSQYLVDPRCVHLVAAKHVMRYLKDKKWITFRGCCLRLGPAMTSWKSREKSSISLSTTKEEYIETCSTNCESIWLQNLLTSLFDLEMEDTMILCDNQSCINMTKNTVFHDKTKHVDIQYHYIHDMVHKGVVKLQYVGIDEQVTDVLTKSLSHVKFEHFRDKIGVV
jgi:hypothetical protein